MRFGSIFLTMDKAQVDLWRTKIIAAYDGEDFSIRNLANSYICTSGENFDLYANGTRRNA